MGVSGVKAWAWAPTFSLLQHHPDFTRLKLTGCHPRPLTEPGGGWGASVSPPEQTGATALCSGCLGSSGSEGSAQLSSAGGLRAVPGPGEGQRVVGIAAQHLGLRKSFDLPQTYSSFCFVKESPLMISQCLYTRCVCALSVGAVCTYMITTQSPTCKSLWESRALDLPLF